MSQAKRTIAHDEIRRWAEARGGKPSSVGESPGGKGGGILRLDFGEPEESLEEISWDEFFRIFEERQLALLYQEETSEGTSSRFNKFVHRGQNE